MLEIYSGRKDNETINWKTKLDEEFEKVCDRFGSCRALIECCSLSNLLSVSHFISY